MAFAMRSLASRSSAFVAAPVAVRRVVVAAPVKTTVVEVEAKLKTRKAAAKRLRVSGTGKVLGRHAGKQHFNEKMTRDKIRDKSKMFVISDANIPNAIKCLPNHGIGGK